MPLNLRIGVLVVGSLDWESKDYGGEMSQRLKQIRTDWRNERLRRDKRSTRFVHVPIRYGRRSGKRENSYTMVFSPERNTKLGVGKVITCSRNITDIAGLVAEAEALWRAEAETQNGDRISASWGCVALATRPNFLDHEDANERTQLLREWQARTEREQGYGRLGFSRLDIESSGRNAVVENGRLNIPWPKFRNHWPLSLDLLLLTATNPEIGQSEGIVAYPSPEQIARAWMDNDRLRPNGQVYYFDCNRAVGIRTVDDDAIRAFLQQWTEARSQ